MPFKWRYWMLLDKCCIVIQNTMRDHHDAIIHFHNVLALVNIGVHVMYTHQN